MLASLRRFLVASAMTSVAAYASWAYLGQRALAAGPELERWAALVGGEFPTTTIELNGTRLKLSTVTSEAEVRDLLDRFRARCREASGGLAESLRDRPLSDDERDVASGLLREESDGMSGVVACLARSSTHDDSASRAMRFLRTRDLAELGQLRYLFARTTEQGNTHALIVTSEGPLRIAAMFPARGDASGSDFVDVPRPRDARRLISAQVAGAPYGVVAYEVDAQPFAAIEQYTADLAPRGYRAVHLQPGDADAYESRALLREDVPLQVHAFRDGGSTIVAVVRMGGVSHARFTAER